MANQLVDFWRRNEPERTAGRSDAELTLDFANYYDAAELAQKYPDWASDYSAASEAMRRGMVQERLTTGDRVRQAIGSGIRGFGGMIASIPEGIAEGAKGSVDQLVRLPGDPEQGSPITEYGTYKLGQGIRKAADWVSPEPVEGLEDSFWATKAPQAVGAGLGFFAGGAAGRAAKIPALRATLFMGGAAGAAEQAADARAHGADDLTALKAAGLGAVVGLSEAVPLNRMLKRLDGVTGGAFTAEIAKRVIPKLGKAGSDVAAETIGDVVEEALQEAAQSTAGNYIAQKLYDKDRELLNGVGEDAAGGAISGFLLSLLTQGVGRARRVQPTEEPATATAAPQPQAVSEAPATAPQATQQPAPQASESIQPQSLMLSDNELAEIAQKQVDKTEDAASELNRVPESELARFLKIWEDIKQRKEANAVLEPAAPAAPFEPTAPEQPTSPPEAATREDGAAALPAQPNENQIKETGAPAPVQSVTPVVEAEGQAPAGAALGQGEGQVATAAQSPGTITGSNVEPATEMPVRPEAKAEARAVEPLGLSRPEFIDPNLSKLSDEEFSNFRKKAKADLDLIESDYDERPELYESDSAERRKLADAQDRYASAELEHFRRGIIGQNVSDLMGELRRMAPKAVSFGAGSTESQKAALIMDEMARQGATIERALSEISFKSPDDKEVFRGQMEDLAKLVGMVGQPSRASEKVIESVQNFSSKEDEARSADQIKARLEDVKAQADTLSKQVVALVEASQEIAKSGDVEAKKLLDQKRNDLVDQQLATAKVQESLEGALEKAESGEMDITKAINLNAVDFDAGSFKDKRTANDIAFPAYYEVGDDSKESRQIDNAYKAYAAQTDKLEKNRAANLLGSLLTRQWGQPGTKGLSRRVTVWAQPDGRMVATTSFDYSGAGGRGPNQRFKFTTEPDSRTGIVEMLENGWRPVASIRLKSFYNNLARYFPSVEAFNAEFGEARQMQKNALISNREAAATAASAKTAVHAGASGETESVVVDTSGEADEDTVSSDAIIDANLGEDRALFERWQLENSDYAEELALILQDEPGVGEDEYFGKVIETVLPSTNRVAKQMLSKDDRKLLVAKILEDARSIYDKFRAGAGAVAQGNEGAAGGAEAAADVGAGGAVQEPVQATKSEAGATVAGREASASPRVGADLVSSFESLIERLDQLKADGKLGKDDRFYNLAVDEITNSETVEEAEEKLEELLEDYQRLTRQRFRRLDDLPDTRYDLESGTRYNAQVVPYTADALVANMLAEQRPKTAPESRSGLLGAVSIKELQSKYPNLSAALGAIASETKGARSLLASRLASVAQQTGAVLSVVDSPKATSPEVAKALGSYGPGSNNLVVNAGAHLNEENLQTTILHEALHAVTSRMGIMFARQPNLLNAQQRVAFRNLVNIMGDAQAAGIRWADMNAGPDISLDEFIAAAMTDPAMRSKLEATVGQTSSKTLWQRFKEFLASIIRSLGLGGEQSAETLLARVEAEVDKVISGYAKNAEAWEDFQKVAQSDRLNPGERFRRIDVAPGADEMDISDQNSLAAAHIGLAAHNDVRRTLAEVYDLAKQVKLRGALKSPDLSKFTEHFMELAVNKAIDKFQDVADAVTKAAADKQLPPPNVEIQADELSGTAKQESYRNSLAIHQALEGALQEKFEEASKKFLPTMERVADLNTKLANLDKMANDISLLERSAARFAKRALGFRADLVANSIANLLGLGENANEQVRAAYQAVQADTATFADALEGMSGLGLDYAGLKPSNKTLTVEQVRQAVAASADPKLQPLKDNPAMLAVAINFAKNNTLEMSLLPARSEKSATEKRVLSDMLQMAVSDKADAFDIARERFIPKLTRLGRTAQRILTELREVKAEQKQAMEMVDRYVDVIGLMERAVMPVFGRKINRLKEYFNAESMAGEGGQQWRPVNGAVYLAPESPNVSARELAENQGRNRGRIRRGDDGNFKQIQEDILKMKAWLANPENTKNGGPVVNDMRRQLELLEWENSKQMSWHQQNGPDGAIMGALGSLSDMLAMVGGPHAQQLGKILTKYDSLLRSNLHGDHTAAGFRYDELKAAAQQSTGTIDPVEFKRRFLDAPLHFRANSKNIDASIPAGATDQQMEDISVKAMMDYLRDPQRFPKNAELFRENPKAMRDVEAMLRQHLRNNRFVEKFLSRMGSGPNSHLKVKDTELGFLRNLIGHYTSTFSRMMGGNISSVVGTEMAETWGKGGKNSTFNDAAGNLKDRFDTDTVKELYLADKPKLEKILADRFNYRIWASFAEPYAKDFLHNHFEAPSVNGIREYADHRKIADAFNAAQGNAIRFAENLYQMEGGDMGDLNAMAEFVGQTITTFQKKYDKLNNIISKAENAIRDDSGETGRVFMDAQEANDLPFEFVDHREFGHWDFLRYVRILAENEAFGSGRDAWKRIFQDAVNDLEKKKNELQQIIERSGNNRKLVNEELNRLGNREDLLNAERSLDRLRKIDVVFNDLVKVMDGASRSEKAFMRVLNQMAGHIVQSPGAALTDLLSLTVAPVRKFGLSRTATAIIGRNWKNYLTTAYGSLNQALGRQWYLNTEHQAKLALANSNGLADIANKASAGTRWRARLADTLSWKAQYERQRLVGRGALSAVARATAKKAYSDIVTAGDIALSAGIGRSADNPAAYPVLKPAIYSTSQQFMNMSTALSWFDTVNDLIDRATVFYRRNGSRLPTDHEVSAKDLGYSDGWVFGDKRAFEYLKSMLDTAGISLDESAKRRLEGRPGLTEQEAARVMTLANEEMLLEKGLRTTPTKLSGRFQVLSPLLRWQVANSADIMRSMFRTPQGKADFKHFTNSMAAFVAATIPASLLWAFLRDLYDEEVVGKKANVMSFVPSDSKDAMERNALALVDRLGRVSALGLAGDFINSAVNVDTNREFSVDSRVFYVSAISNLLRTIQNFYKQDFTADYANVVRPMMGALGGAGYLQTFDAINNQLGLDNMERRIVTRVNVNNLLRSVGRELGMEVRTGRGMRSIPNPTKPWVGQMVMSAYMNDASGFRDAYTKALEAAVKDGEEDPQDAVFRQYQSQFPLGVVFAQKPTERQYQQMLAALGDKADEVNRAIANYMAYSAYIPRGRGRTAKEIDFAKPRGLTSTAGGGTVPRRDYRELTTSF